MKAVLLNGRDRLAPAAAGLDGEATGHGIFADRQKIRVYLGLLVASTRTGLRVLKLRAAGSPQSFHLSLRLGVIASLPTSSSSSRYRPWSTHRGKASLIHVCRAL